MEEFFKLMFRIFRKFISKFLLRHGKAIVLSSSEKDLRDLILSIWPKKSEFDLVRIGGNNDGGYLLPSCLDGISQCFSPGVGNSMKFEEDLFSKFNIHSVMLDHTIDNPALFDNQSIFLKKQLSYEQISNSITLEELVTNYESNDNDKILQMDIEGGEYQILINTDIDTLQKFRIIIIEFHDLHNLRTRYFLKLFNEIMNKITRSFQIVHIHPNNFAERFSIGGMELSSCLEITFLRQDYFFNKGLASLPHPLDEPSAAEIEDILLIS